MPDQLQGMDPAGGQRLFIPSARAVALLENQTRREGQGGAGHRAYQVTLMFSQDMDLVFERDRRPLKNIICVANNGWSERNSLPLPYRMDW